MRKILLIEDEKAIAQNIADYLKGVDPTLSVLLSYDGIDGFSLAAQEATIDLLVLDIGLPGLDGIEVCKRLRDIGWNKPIIMLTALDTIPDRIKGLDSGADDYLVKPFSLAELHARIRARLRRVEKSDDAAIFRVSDLVLDTRLWKLTRGDRPIRLSANAMRVLAVLMKKSPAVVTREELMHEVWNNRFATPETIRSHVYMVRNAVDAEGEKPLIHTIKPVGWAIREE